MYRRSRTPGSILVAALVALLPGPALADAAAYATAVLADGPIGYWKLDETSGTSAADASTSTNDGTFPVRVEGRVDVIQELALGEGVVVDRNVVELRPAAVCARDSSRLRCASGLRANGRQDVLALTQRAR